MGEPYVVFENTDDVPDELAAIQAAAATWNSAGAKFKFTYGGSSTNPAPLFDDVNEIRWGTMPGTVAASLTYWFNTATPQDILEVDLVFNNDYTWSTSATTPAGAFDLQSAMLHQFGGYLALGKSDIPEAVMYSFPPMGTQRRTLHADDRAGIKAIYGSACSAIGLSADVISQGLGQAIVNVVLLFSTVLLVPLGRVLLRNARLPF